MRLTDADLNFWGVNPTATGLDVRPTLHSDISSVATITREAVGRNIVRDRITFDSSVELNVGADNANKGDGLGLLVMPARLYRPISFRLNLTLSDNLALGETTAGEIGIGTTIATGAVNVLSGTAGFENFLTGQTLGNITAAGTLAVTGQIPVSVAAVGSVISESTLYLNHASAFSDEASAHGVDIDSGFLEMIYEVYAN
ncbi:MAG: hypothetical protein RIB60_06065 [Phycisphaerales bacterium]